MVPGAIISTSTRRSTARPLRSRIRNTNWALCGLVVAEEAPNAVVVRPVRVVFGEHCIDGGVDCEPYAPIWNCEPLFDDGTEKTVDVSSLLTGPVFEPLQEPSFFSKVTVDPISQTVVWPNGADLAPEALHDLESIESVA